MTAAIGASLLLISLKQGSIPSNIVRVVVGDFLILTGLVQKYALGFSGTKETTGIKDAVIVGVIQAFTTFPGLTISALLFRGYNPQRANKISSMISIPVVLAAKVRLDLIDVATCDAAAIV